MRRPDQSKAARELDSITSSFLQVRVLHCASASPATASAITDRLRWNAGDSNPGLILARMTRNGLLKVKAPPTSRAPSTREYSLTPKGRRLLHTAKEYLRHIAMKSLPVLLFCSAITACAQAQNAPLTLDKTIPMPKVEGRIDHLAADIAGQRLFVAALGNNSVEVLDLKAGQTIQTLPGFAEPQGIAYVPESDRLFVANGQDGTCRILEGHSFKTISSVACGDDADNVRYDARANRIYVGYGGGALAVLDAKTGAKLADIKLAGHPESFRLESAGRLIFVNVPKAEHIAVVDREKAEVTATWPLKEAKSNFPLILDEASYRLFSGCRNPARVLVYDYSATPGRLVSAIPISRDTDDLFYDAANKRLYVSCGQGTIDIIRQTDAEHYTVEKSISTATGARTSLFVSELKILCVAVPHRGNQLAEIRVFKTH